MPPEKSRRAFLSDCGKLLGCTAFAAVILPVLQGCEPSSIPVAPSGSTKVDVSDLSESNPVKQAPGLSGPDGRGVIITRKSETEYFAFSMQCPHQGSNIETSLQDGSIPCLTHGSQFDLDGSVVQGPATSALRKYPIEFDPTNKIVTVLFS